jgi:acyl CoA:acetate/3-ketoacid CoA transferase beta subunit
MTVQNNDTKLGSNPAKQKTLGVPLDGFQDPTGEFPKTNYHYSSSINYAARGFEVNELYLGGGDFNVSLNLEDQQPSQYPFNQVQETASGHVIEYDDTPGGERILIKHRKGGGIEMRADGSIIISSPNNKVEVTGGDNTVIVEGDAEMVYKGNLNQTVTGDWNMDVGGNHNLNIHGHNKQTVLLNKRTEVCGNTEHITKQSASYKTVENKTELVLGNNTEWTKGYSKEHVEGELNVFTDNRLIMTAKDEYIQTAPVMAITGAELSVMGMKGVIGGEQVEMTSPVYMGPKGAVPFASGAAFYGSFHGQSTEAIRSYNSNVSRHAEIADMANAQSYGEAVTAGSAHGKTNKPAVEGQETPTPKKPVPLADAIGAMMTMGDFSVRTVTVDAEDVLKNKILLRDDFEGLFEKIPTTQEIRSTIRDTANRSLIGNKMVGEGRLNAQFDNTSPPKIGRTAAAKQSSRFGSVPIGNSISSRGKRFTG